MPVSIRVNHFLLITTLISFLTCDPALAITIIPSNTEPRAYDNHGTAPVRSPQDLFRHSCPNEHQAHPNATVHFSSDFSFENGTIHPSSSSLIRGTLDAWAQHQHLILRPDEVWFSILTQLNLYMSKTSNAEALREVFVSHPAGEKKVIFIADTSIQGILSAFGEAIEENTKTDWLYEWVTPAFTTSTPDDAITANVLLMGLMQTYFEYEGMIICGLPSVTLLGDKEDWQRLLGKIDRLEEFGKEAEMYAYQLRPILSRFVRTFDEPDDEETRAFWNSIVHAEPTNGMCGMPPYYISGWLLGFLFWDRKGEPLYPSWRNSTELDGIKYSPLSISDLPIGYAQVPFTLRYYNGRDRFPSYLVAGNIAKEVTVGIPDGYSEGLRRFNGSEVDETLPHGVLEPKSGWLLYGPADHNTTRDWPSFEDEIGTLRAILDQTDPSLCPGQTYIDLGAENADSMAYEAFREEMVEGERVRYEEMENLYAN